MPGTQRGGSGHPSPGRLTGPSPGRGSLSLTPFLSSKMAGPPNLTSGAPSVGTGFVHPGLWPAGREAPAASLGTGRAGGSAALGPGERPLQEGPALSPGGTQRPRPSPPEPETRPGPRCSQSAWGSAPRAERGGSCPGRTPLTPQSSGTRGHSLGLPSGVPYPSQASTRSWLL